MNLKCLFLYISFFLAGSLQAQLLIWSPDFIQENSSTVDITCDATRGNQGLKDYTATDVYVHIGVITNLSNGPTDWKYVPFTWGTTPAAAKATSTGVNTWKFTISGGLRSFFNISNASEHILKIAILFRSGNGQKKLANVNGTDMFVPVYDNGLNVRIDQPFRQPVYDYSPEPIIKNAGDAITITAKGNPSSTLKLILNGDLLNSATGIAINSTAMLNTGGRQVILAEAFDGVNTKKDSVTFFISGGPQVAPLPAGVRDGINYEPGDTSVVLVLFAPHKSSVFILGDFNDWQQSTSYQMTVTPDSNRYWLRVTGLKPGTEYAYQYLVDGNLRIADYYTEKVLDPDFDLGIPQVTYPNLKAYPSGKTTGIVSTLQMAKPAYDWQVGAFKRPDKRNLLIYELLIRDFVGKQNWSTLTDTLSYLKRLGVNTIEVMPFNEFEGNDSWGYNPDFYFAPDKFYGTESALRRFVDECHRSGMAVVMDIAMNHSFGRSPMVQLYFDAVSGKPAMNSPWFNTDPKHPYNVGYDFNHESQATKDFVDRVVEHWLTNYKIDGFRWDLSKGFTQTNNPNNVNAWGAYDASRIAIWKRIYDKMQSISPESYCILEHFADNSEETELSSYGMLLWGNSNYNFNEATMGYVGTSNFESALSQKRGWSKTHLVAYQESHDEERLMFKNLTFGNTSNATYNTRDLATALKRNEMAACFWAMMPGPKMLWQFGELGYDQSITSCKDGSLPQPYPSSQCRLDSKPLHWDYQSVPARKALYSVYSRLLNLRNTSNFLSTFTSGNVSWNFSGGFKKLQLSDDSLKIAVIGNFDVVAQSSDLTLPTAGTWYDLLSGTVFTSTGTAQSINLQPGEYHVYTNRDLGNLVVTALADIRPGYGDKSIMIYPDPVNSDAEVIFDLPASGKVNVTAYDMQGRMVGNVSGGIRPKGRNMVSFGSMGWRIPEWKTGMYILVIDVNGRRLKKQFIVAR
jgi:glycosidase